MHDAGGLAGREAAGAAWRKAAAGRRSKGEGSGVAPGSGAVTELLRSNDLVRLSWLTALLSDAGITAVTLDAHTSVVEGSIGAIPRRLMVGDADAARAHRLLAEAEELDG